MKIQDIIRSVPSDPLEAFWAMIEIAANKLGADAPIEDLRHGRLLRDGTTRILLEGAAELLLKEDRQARYNAIVGFLDQCAASGRRAGEFWIRRETSELLIGLVHDPKSVRFCFQAAFRPWLAYAVRMAERQTPPRIFFSSGSADLEHASKDLTAVLELSNVSVGADHPWDREAPRDVDFEVMLPPLGMPIQDLDRVSARLMAPLGGSGRIGRVNAETLSILHALDNKAARSVILMSEGELFRMVGAEAIVRRHLVESGRLEAVLGAPPGLFYASTMVKLGLLILSGEQTSHDTVRFVDLGHEGLSYRGTRGRFEFDFDPGTGAADLISGPEPADKTMGRDVGIDEILEHNFVLAPDRYLNAGLRDRIDTLMRDADAASLPDVVEMIRPANLQKSLGEDYTIFEASPGDIGERGYLEKPSRSFAVDRATYTRALNQRVQPGDVLLSIKGTIGVAGLVPEDVPHEGDAAIWTAGQSLMILRPKKRSGMDPIALYEYLTDEIVQEFIKSLAGGSVIQNLAMKDLKAFPVPVPSKEVMEDVRVRFMARQALLDQVANIQQQIAAERAEQWPHAQLARTR